MGKRKGGTRQRYRRGRDYAKITPAPEPETEYDEDALDLGYVMAERASMGFPVIGPLREAQDAAYEAYLAWQDDQPEECGASYTTGPSWDPYGTSCDLEPGHDGPHEGLDPLPVVDGDRVQWQGGGMCAGDPLPYRDVKRIQAGA